MEYSINYAINRSISKSYKEQENRIRYEIAHQLGNQLGDMISDDIVSGKLKSEARFGINDDVFTVRLHVLSDLEYRNLFSEAIRIARIQMERGEPVIFKLEEK